MPDRAVTVHLIQCLCPERHCILAAAFEDPPGTVAAATGRLKDTIEAWIVSGTIDPWCGLCQAGRDTWTFEVKSIPGKTLEEIMPLLRASEGEQRLTAAAVQVAREKASRN